MDDDLGPVGDRESFSDGGETHEIWFENKGSKAWLMMASTNPSRLERKLDAYQESIDLLASSAETSTARSLLAKVRSQLTRLDDEASALAGMKLATRNAKAAYEQNKDKPRKRNGQKKGKSGGKELAKKVAQDEKTLRDPLSRLALMLLEVPFKPIKRPAAMYRGQQDPVEVRDDKDRAGLYVERLAGKTRLDAAAEGPLKAAHNQRGESAVKAAIQKIDKIAMTVSKTRTRRGKVNAAAYKRLEEPAGGAQTLIGDLGQRMRVANLARLLSEQGMQKPVPVIFKVKPAELHAKAKLAGKNQKLYADAFIKEMKRQVELQRVGINKLNVDQWVFHINLYKFDRARYLELDHSARAAILEEFQRRGDAALKTTRTRQSELKSALLHIKAALNKEARGEEGAPKAEAVDLAVGRTGQEKVFRRTLTTNTKGVLAQKAGAKKTIFAQLLAEQNKLQGEDTDWKLLADNGSQLVILHNADQVAGGYDRFNNDLLNPPGPNDAVAVWKLYLKNLMEHVGPRDVNSSIGSQWSNEVDAAYKAVTTLVSQEGYPVHGLRLEMKVQ